MAFLFNSDADEYARALPTGFTHSSGQHWTIAAMARFTSLTGQQTILAFGDDAATDFIWWGASANATKIGSNGKTPGTGGTLSTGVWYHMMLDWDGTDLSSYIDGTSDTDIVPTSGIVWGDLDQLDVGHLYDDGAAINWARADIAEVAMWDSTLSTGEHVALGAGFSPLLIRPASLIFYCPFVREDTTPLDATAWSTATGASVSNHPRVIKPSAQILQFPSLSVTNTTIEVPLGPIR